MVAVGDEGLMPAQVRADAGHFGRVGDRPQAVAVAVLGGRGQERGLPGHAFDRGRRDGLRAVAAVGEEQGLQIRRGGAHQGRAVGDDMRHDVLVRQDHALRRLREEQGADDPALEQAGSVALFVHVQAGLGVGGQNALGEPAAQGAGRLFVAFGRGRRLRENQPDDVVRVVGLELVQAVGADHDVVRR